MTFRLINDDCLKALKDIDDNSVDLVVTDPPYDTYAGKGGGAFGKRDNYQDILSMSNGFNLDVLNELNRVIKKLISICFVV